VSALIDLPLQDWYYDGASKAQTKNLGSLGGSLQLGDGITSATFPTFVGGGKRGVVSTVANYGINHLTAPAMDTTGSVFELVYVPPSVIALGSSVVLAIQTLVGASYATGWLFLLLNNSILAYWGSVGPVTQAACVTAGVHSVSMTNDGSLVRLYWDGVPVGVPALGGTSTQTGIGIGGVLNHASQGYSGRIYDAKVYSFALQETQVKSLHDRSMKRINLY
jgi:hypothetical protein